MSLALSPRWRAALQAAFVTFLWATSWVLIKIGLAGGEGIPPLTFAGLRYGLAFVCLLPLAARPAHLAQLRAMPPGAWGRLALLGFVFYTLTQGAQFVSLRYLPAITVNLLLNFSPLAVALLGTAFLGEHPTRVQWLGMGLGLLGAVIFFYPAFAPGGPLVGYAAAGVGVLANAVSALMGRAANRAAVLPPVLVTTVSMGVGALALLAAGLALQGLPALTLAQWGLVAWLAVVNTAFAFTLWNHTLRTLSAFESSILNGLMVVFIPLLAWLFLDEALTPAKLGGLALAGLGALVVQLRATRPA